MKIRILDRILVALAGLLVLAACAALAAQLFFQQDVVGFVSKLLSDPGARIYLIIGLALLALLGLYCLLVLFRHRGRKDKFVMQKTDNGELTISLKAMESMVQKCLDPHKELNTQYVKLENQKGGLLIRIRGNVAGGVSIPLAVDALQQQIKQYVTACSGVEVKDIRVQIESSGPEAEDSLFAIEPPTAKALPGSTGSRTEKETEQPAEEPVEMPPEEVDKVQTEMPAPKPSDAEDRNSAAAISAAAAAAAEMLKNEAPPEDDDRPIHQRLFSNPEEPCVMPMPPQPEADAGDAGAEPAADEAPKGTGTEEKEPDKAEGNEIPKEPAAEGGAE